MISIDSLIPFFNETPSFLIFIIYFRIKITSSIVDENYSPVLRLELAETFLKTITSLSNLKSRSTETVRLPIINPIIKLPITMEASTEFQ